MKKFLSMLLSAALLTSLLAGCGSGGQSSSAASGGQSAPTESASQKPAETGGGKSIKVGFVISALNEPIMHAYNDYMQKAMKQAAEAAGYTLDYVSTSSDGDVNKEFSNVQDMVTSGCKVVIINAIDNVASLAAVKECHDNGVKSIFFCREAADSAAGEEVPDATVNMDSYDQGYSSTKRMFEIMKQDGAAPKDMIVVKGYENDVNAINRQAGCEKACEEAGVKIATTVSCGQWDPATCLTNLTSALQTYPDSNCLYVPSDSQYSGYSTALQRANKWFPHGEKGHVYIAGTDVFPDGFVAIAKGYQETSTENPVWLNAQKAAECAIKLADGEDLKGQVFKIKGDTVDSTNYKTIDYLWCLDYSDQDLRTYQKQ